MHQNQQQIVTVTISEDTANEIIQYFSTCPLGQVLQLYSKLVGEIHRFKVTCAPPPEIISADAQQGPARQA